MERFFYYFEQLISSRNRFTERERANTAKNGRDSLNYFDLITQIRK